MPDIKQGESQKDFVARCIPYVIKEENKTQEQAQGKCFGMYRQHKRKGIVKALRE